MRKTILSIYLITVTSITMLFTYHYVTGAVMPVNAAPRTPTGTFTGNVTVISYPTTTKAGIKVHLVGTSLSTLTDASGNYTINNVPIDTLYTIVAYDVDPNLPQGIGTTWLNVWNNDAVRFGVYIPSANATVTLPPMEVDHNFLGGP